MDLKLLNSTSLCGRRKVAPKHAGITLRWLVRLLQHYILKLRAFVIHQASCVYHRFRLSGSGYYIFSNLGRARFGICKVIFAISTKLKVLKEIPNRRATVGAKWVSPISKLARLTIRQGDHQTFNRGYFSRYCQDLKRASVGELSHGVHPPDCHCSCRFQILCGPNRTPGQLA